jgi:hypothetical protein
MKITSDIETTFVEVRKLNLTPEQYSAVINIIADYGSAVGKKTTQTAIEIFNR